MKIDEKKADQLNEKEKAALELTHKLFKIITTFVMDDKRIKTNDEASVIISSVLVSLIAYYDDRGLIDGLQLIRALIAVIDEWDDVKQLMEISEENPH